MYRCCRHCAEDPVHVAEKDQHEIPCGGMFGVCSDGGTLIAPDAGDVYDFDWED